MKSRTSKYPRIHPAMIAVWAALISVAGLLPSFPVFATGGSFSISYALAPLAGIMFGPWAGALTVAIGELLATFIAPHTATLGIFTFLINTTNSFVAGFMSRKKWHIGFIVIALFTVVWFIIPMGRDAALYGIVVYGAGLIMCPIGGILGTRLYSLGGMKRFIGFFLMAWPCYIAGSIVGNIITLYLVEIPPELWNTLLIWMTPFERTLFAIGSTIVGIPLLIGLPKISIYVGPEYDKQDEEDELDRLMAKKSSKGGTSSSDNK